LRVFSASRATPPRQSATVPNTSKNNAWTSGSGFAAACAHVFDGLRSAAPETASAAPPCSNVRRLNFFMVFALPFFIGPALDDPPDRITADEAGVRWRVVDGAVAKLGSRQRAGKVVNSAGKRRVAWKTNAAMETG
jgi:hypothetical protein